MLELNDATEMTEELLQAVLDAYPNERIGQAKSRLRSAWMREPLADRIPWVIYPTPPVDPPDLPETVPEERKDLIVQLLSMLKHSPWGDAYVPGLAPGIRQVLIPSYFGCVEESAEGSIRVKPIISDPSSVYSLPECGFGAGTIGGQMLDKVKFFLDATRGLLPVYEPDIQGPFSVASQIWGVEDFLLALYEHPAEVKHLIERCTEALLLFLQKLREIAGENLISFHCPTAVWYPPELGLAYSEDLMAVISPSAAREYIAPSLDRISSELGGSVLHSCGAINHLAGELSGRPGLKGVNFASSETDLPAFLRDADRRLNLVVHNSPVGCRDLPILDAEGHASFCARAFSEADVQGVCVILFGISDLDPTTHSPIIADILKVGRESRPSSFLGDIS